MKKENKNLFRRLRQLKEDSTRQRKKSMKLKRISLTLLEIKQLKLKKNWMPSVLKFKILRLSSKPIFHTSTIKI
jgi:hypothetical protein